MKLIKSVLALTVVVSMACSHKEVEPGTQDREPAAQKSKALETALSDINEQRTLNWGSINSDSLNKCLGSIRLERNEGTLELVVSNTKNCSNVYQKLEDGEWKLIGDLDYGRGDERIGLPEKVGKNKFLILLASNTGKTSALITVNSTVAPKVKSKINPKGPADFSLSTSKFGRRWSPLEECGGSVTLSIEGGTVYLYFQRLNNKKCSLFDVLSSDGDDLDYRAQKIGSQAERTEKIALPRRFYDAGINDIKVIVRSESGKTGDMFRVKFFAL